MTETRPNRTVLVGANRRITIDELLILAVSRDGRLEVLDSSNACDTENPDAPLLDITFEMSKLSMSESDTTEESLSESSSLAVVALLALVISQGRLLTNVDSLAVANGFVDLFNKASFNSSSMIILPKDPLVMSKVLASALSTSSSSIKLFLDSTLPKILERLIPLSISALSAGTARNLITASDCIAALSAERLQIDPTKCFADIFFDTLRPHRGCITSANILRAILQGSTFAKASLTKKERSLTKDKGEEQQTSSSQEEMIPLEKKAVMNTPQYSGPARDSILSACKTLELEMNCSEPKPGMELDGTIFQLSADMVYNSVIALLNGSQGRMGKIIPSTSKTVCTASDLEKAVKELKTSLEAEGMLNIQFLETQAREIQIVTQKKEAEKAARAAEFQNKAKQTKENEFEGMTEAQKNKILRKRAEKEAKAAAKKAKNKSVATTGANDFSSVLSSIFGMGTGPLMTILSTESGSLSLTTSVVSDMTIQIEKLLSGGVQRKPKIPKGTRDYLPEQMMIRQQAFTIIRRVFESHGAVEIDTPVFELKETLTGKYGEDSKLIYDLADQGGELLALRYDLTVPFARFLSLNPVGNIKRFHIGKVYRRDQPALSRGRYREFYQCDFDIAGKYGRMVPDSECLCVVCEILDSLPIGDFGIKLNHRKLLDAILDLCGVPSDKFRTICSAVDKLDKEPWEEVKREMVEDKGLKSEVADKIGTFVLKKGEPWEMYNSLMDSKIFGTHKGALTAMEDLRILFTYLEAMNKLRFISFDLSLARGLDYYTGVIYEAVCMSGNTQVGSIGGGGRYDNLVSMFQEAGKITPCVGVSVGIERVFTLMEANLRAQSKDGNVPKPNVTVLIASAGSNSPAMICEKMKISEKLWNAKISAEFNQAESVKLKNEITNALSRDIPYMVVIGEEEAKENKCKLKDLNNRTEDLIMADDLVKILLNEKGVVPVGCEFAKELLNELNK